MLAKPRDDVNARRVRFDRARAALFQRGYCAEDIAEALGVSVSTFSHLRSGLAYAPPHCDAPQALCDRFLAWAASVLAATPDRGSTASTAPHTLGRHLRSSLRSEATTARQPLGQRQRR